MRVAITMVLVLTTQAIMLFAQASSSPRMAIGTQPIKRGTAFTILNYAVIPQSLQELRNYSELIIEGTVEKLIVREHGQGLETDVLVSVDRVVKGDFSLQRIVIAETGGTQGDYQEVVLHNIPMKAGEHYFLFLLSDKRSDIPAVSGRDRYSVVCGLLGKVQIVEDKLIFNAASPMLLKGVYNGISIDQFRNAILAQ